MEKIISRIKINNKNFKIKIVMQKVKEILVKVNLFHLIASKNKKNFILRMPNLINQLLT